MLSMFARIVRQRHRAPDPRRAQRRQPADRAPRPRAQRHRRCARHRDHGHDRREGVRRQRRLPARRRAGPLLCRIFRASTISPRPSSARSSAARSCDGRRAWGRAGRCDRRPRSERHEFHAQSQAEPWRFDFFALLRQLERTFKDRPRIGDSAARREEFVRLGQDPFMEFPGLESCARRAGRRTSRCKIFVKFLGLLGPQGALPLATTEEAYHYALAARRRISRAFSTCSITASFNCSSAPGRTRGRSRSTIVPTPTASLPISAR